MTQFVYINCMVRLCDNYKQTFTARFIYLLVLKKKQTLYLKIVI